MLTALGLVSGLVQLLLGFMGIGSLIKYIPFPVVSGYLTGVGLIIIGSQIPKFLGVPGGTAWWRALISPELWQWQSALIGAVTAGVMITAPMLTRVVPAAILGLLAGVLTYFGLASVDESLLVIEGNKLIIGPLGGNGVQHVRGDHRPLAGNRRTQAEPDRQPARDGVHARRSAVDRHAEDRRRSRCPDPQSPRFQPRADRAGSRQCRFGLCRRHAGRRPDGGDAGQSGEWWPDPRLRGHRRRAVADRFLALGTSSPGFRSGRWPAS
jgi:hypothetical protein